MTTPVASRTGCGPRVRARARRTCALLLPTGGNREGERALCSGSRRTPGGKPGGRLLQDGDAGGEHAAARCVDLPRMPPGRAPERQPVRTRAVAACGYELGLVGDMGFIRGCAVECESILRAGAAVRQPGRPPFVPRMRSPVALAPRDIRHAPPRAAARPLTPTLSRKRERETADDGGRSNPSLPASDEGTCRRTWPQQAPLSACVRRRGESTPVAAAPPSPACGRGLG